MVLYVIDALAVLFIVIGFHLAFRQRLVRTWFSRLRPQHTEADIEGGAGLEDPHGVASVMRMAGVMIMAFSFTGATFANLIAYFSAHGVN